MDQEPKAETRVYHVDWESRSLSHVEVLVSETEEMPEQGRLFEKMFASGDTILTTFSTLHPHNRMPEAMLGSQVGTLKWNNNYSIPDFGYDESGVYGNLSFNSRLQFVYISWKSILEMTGQTSGISAAWQYKPESEST